MNSKLTLKKKIVIKKVWTTDKTVIKYSLGHTQKIPYEMFRKVLGIMPESEKVNSNRGKWY